MAFDKDANLFVFDVGTSRREEVNLIRANDRSGPNFGWFVFEGNHCKNDNPNCPSTEPGVTFPIVELKHPFIEAIIGGAFIKEQKFLSSTGT